MDCKFNFQPVGQGGFTSCIFQENSDTIFSFVYDCGSITSGNYLYQQIKSAKNELKFSNSKRVIDLLVISHFDEDHINGIQELLLDVRCKVLVIPFLTIAERLTIFARKSQKADWHIQFLQNPKLFFQSGEYEIDKIIFVDSDNPFIEKEYLSIDIDSSNLVSNSGNNTPRINKGGIEFDTRFIYMQIPFSLKVTSIDFELKFYIQPFADKAIQEFEDSIKLTFPNTDINLLFDNKHRSILKLLYKNAFKNINKTSLCVSISDLKDRYPYYYDIPKNLLFNYESRKSGLIFTGDSFLKSKKARKDFCSYYKEEIGETLLFQIPHHGSKANSKLCNSNLLWEFPFYIVQYGNGREKHPSQEMNNFITKNKLIVERVTELNGCIFGYQI